MQREARALDICEMMNSQHTVQLAIKYATRLRMMQLAQRLTEVARRKADQEQQDDDDEEEDFTAIPRPSKVSQQPKQAAEEDMDAQDEETGDAEDQQDDESKQKGTFIYDPATFFFPLFAFSLFGHTVFLVTLSLQRPCYC